MQGRERPQGQDQDACSHMVRVHNLSVEAADYLMQCPDWVSMGGERFREGDMAAFRPLHNLDGQMGVNDPTVAA